MKHLRNLQGIYKESPGLRQEALPPWSCCPRCASMLRRVSSLFNTYDGKEPELDYKGMVKRAEDIVIVKTNCKGIGIFIIDTTSCQE